MAATAFIVFKETAVKCGRIDGSIQQRSGSTAIDSQYVATWERAVLVLEHHRRLTVIGGADKDRVLGGVGAVLAVDI